MEDDDLMDEFAIEQKKDMLRSLHQFDESFEVAIQASMHSIQESIEQCRINHGHYARKFDGVNTDDWDEVADNIELIEKMAEYRQSEEVYEDQLIALSEMRVIYLFKNLEISMKSLIKMAYPKIELKNFFQWENMKSFFEQKDIKLHELKGYAEVLELKKLNNNFKHSDELDNSILKIPEFDQGFFSEM